MSDNRVLIRYIGYRRLFEEFLISAVVAILGIRVFLKVTHYPSIGGDVLHISHMLWGGFLMFLALGLMFVFLDIEVKKAAAVIGGLGFGTFIDEIGKFITSDNNYFYKPTFSVIYILFILIYLVLHLIDRRKEFTQKEYLVNSIELMKDAVINDLDEQEKERAMLYLSRADQDDSLTKTLHQVYTNTNEVKFPQQNIFSITQQKTKELYFALIKKNWFRQALLVFFLLQALLSLIIAVLLIIERNPSILPALLLPHAFTVHSFNTLHLYSTLASILFILWGAAKMYSSRLEAFIMFKRSILVSILLSQVFAFYYNPTRAFATLIFNVIILSALNYMIENERNLKKIT